MQVSAAQRPVGTGRAPSALTIYRVAWLPTRAWLRTETPAPRSAATTSSTVLVSGTETSSDAPTPSKMRHHTPPREAAIRPGNDFRNSKIYARRACDRMFSLGVERTGWPYVNDAIDPQETFAPVVRNVGGKKI